MSRDSQKPAPQAAAGQTPGGQTSAGQTSAGQTSAGQTPAGQTPAGPADPRGERLARALRDNLKKRKAQQRARRAGPEASPGCGEDSPGGGA